jgi:molecular chaperone DnaK
MLLSIDFGTCNSSAALIGNGTIKPIKEPLKHGYSFPSSVYLTEQGDFLVGQAAENNRLRDIRRYRTKFKKELGNGFPCRLGDRSFSADELVTEVLSKLKI